MVKESSLVKSKLLSRIKHARDIASQSHTAGRKRARVAFFEWPSPIYLGGHWTPQIIRWSNASKFKSFLISFRIRERKFQLMNQNFFLFQRECK
jgi:hypothetical protein